MSGSGYVILGYAVGIVLLWGYALVLWMSLRTAAAADKVRARKHRDAQVVAGGES